MPRCLPILIPYLDRFFIDFYLQLRSPEPSKSWFFLKEKRGFFKKSLFEVGIDFCSILVPTCLHFSFKNPPKSIQKPILKGIDFLIDFDIDFKTAQEGPKTAQDAPRRRSKRQDGPKRPPRRPQDGPKRPQEFVLFSCFLVHFWSMFGRLSMVYALIFDRFSI